MRQRLDGQEHSAPNNSGGESTYARIDEPCVRQHNYYNEQSEMEQEYFSSDDLVYDSLGEYGQDSHEQEHSSWDEETYNDYDHKETDDGHDSYSNDDEYGYPESDGYGYDSYDY